jgi:hypothetical protein
VIHSYGVINYFYIDHGLSPVATFASSLLTTHKAS